MKRGTFLSLLFIVPFLFITLAFASSPPLPIPPALAPWTSWVLYEHEDRLCPTPYDTGTHPYCAWPSRLTLKVTPKGASFTQTWLIFKAGFISLPGSKSLWPLDITIDGTASPIIERNGRPAVFLPPGEHTVAGHFRWSKVPEMIPIPPECGLIYLTVEGKKKHPVLDSKGRLWLQKKPETLTLEDKLSLQAFRLLEDTIPLQITTLLRLNIAGHPREISIKGTLLPGAVPMEIKSPLPARLGRKGILYLQGRPGQWEVQVKSYLKGHVKTITPGLIIGSQEIWSFKPHTQIRMVKIKGAPTIDPRQTALPKPWKSFSAFLITPETRLILQELRRGDPSPAPDQLNLQRSWWLDFDGKGFTIQDKISGIIRRSWRLTVNPPLQLGRAAVDGKDQLITRLRKSDRAGIELRRGRLRMTADLRLEGHPRILPAIGWDHDFHAVSGILNLPPGWRLLAITGPDTTSGTWLETWTLLDLFVVVVIAIIIGRLFGPKWAILAFVALALTYHEKGAPRLVWLSVLVPIALLRFLPKGWFFNLIKLWRLGAIAALLIISLPFMVYQVRVGFYPQLEKIRAKPSPLHPDRESVRTRHGKVGHYRQVPTKGPVSKHTLLKKTYSYNRSFKEQASTPPLAPERQKAVFAYDPNVRVQTGPGIPTWKWRKIQLYWNGPVEKSQTLHLWLLSPGINLFLSLIRVFLLAWLILLCTESWKLKKSRSFKSLWLTTLFFTFAPLNFFMPTTATATSFPPASLLQELQKRLLKPPTCLPHCATNPRLSLTITPGSLQMLLEIHAAADTAVPLPGTLRSWQPTHVLLDQNPAKGLLRDSSGRLWVFVPEGIHRLALTGSVSNLRSFQLPFKLLPHHVSTTTRGWQIKGISETGRILSTLQFTREEETTSTETFSPAPASIPPFFHVTRTLSLGLQWSISTTVERLTPPDIPYVLQVPLIHGESVTTEGLEVKDGKITLSFGSGSRSVRWRSHLEFADIIQLTSPEGVPWTETWILDASPVWHCKITGIPAVHHQDPKGYWQPTWKPWPGEGVTIKVTRPAAIPGEVSTIHKIGVTLDKGKRFNRILLSLNIKTSQGFQYTLHLPSGAKLQNVMLNGKTQPIQIRNGKLALPLHPGEQTLQVTWLQAISSSLLTQLPRINVGQRAVNATFIYKLPKNRWILWTHGPTLGPAVLLWSYLVVILIGAFALGKIPWTPLKTHHWLLLGLGLTQVHPVIIVVVAGWVLAMGIRKKEPPVQGTFRFNASQILLVVWTLAALMGLYLAIKKGLLGIPEMQIAGNGSHNGWLRWTQDRTTSSLPRPWVFSLPLTVYRGLMLLWALWLAYSLIQWLRWAWQCLNAGGGWKKFKIRSDRTLKMKKPSPPHEPESQNEHSKPH